MSSTIPEPAHKVWIEELREGRFEDISINQVRYFRLPWGSVSKVRVMGLVINSWMSDDGTFAWIEVHDGSGSIQVKAWEEDIDRITDPDTGKLLETGSLVDVIGRIRSWRDTLYLYPILVIKVRDPNAIFLRELEVLRRKLRYQAAPRGVSTAETLNLRTIIKLLKEIGPLDGREMADLLKVDEGQLIVQLHELEDLGLIYEDNGKYVYVGWGDKHVKQRGVSGDA
ncbi:MAG: OB-fold nucleic acid binding domain-containing protein [Candidatus Korarchaeota archaeon]|nr:OB-fold nucleic acid binding domain-containing protein [Candidatus Korarchaeota archaeon]